MLDVCEAATRRFKSRRQYRSFATMVSLIGRAVDSVHGGSDVSRAVGRQGRRKAGRLHVEAVELGGFGERICCTSAACIAWTAAAMISSACTPLGCIPQSVCKR